jgi:hypothetical protein
MNIIQVPAARENYGNPRIYPVKKIVMHWMAGSLASCDATFKNPSRKASAHYGIGGSTIHQYVQEDQVAWHAGGGVNYESIGIEHEGGYPVPGGLFKPTMETCNTSAQLVADICRRYKIPCDRNTVKKHSEYMSTECPGTLDIDYIISQANLLLNGNQMAQTDFEIVKVGNNLAVHVLAGEVRGKVIIRNLTTGGDWTTDVNQGTGGTSGAVCLDFGESLYEVEFAGIKKQLDLRPQVDPKDNIIASLNQQISDLKQAAKDAIVQHVQDLQSLSNTLKSDYDNSLAIAKNELTNSFKVQLNQLAADQIKALNDKDLIIEQLRKRKLNFFEWISSLFN